MKKLLHVLLSLALLGALTLTAFAATLNTNHSNAGVSVKLDYTPAADYTGITGTFQNAAEETVTALNLATAEGTTPATAPGATATLNLSGELPESASSVTVGSVTVTLNN